MPTGIRRAAEAPRSKGEQGARRGAFSIEEVAEALKESGVSDDVVDKMRERAGFMLKAGSSLSLRERG